MSKKSSKHSKHAKLTKPVGGSFHRNEWTLIGAPCNLINELSITIYEHLTDQLKLGYLDAAHNAGQKSAPFQISYTDNIEFQTIHSDFNPGQNQYRKFFTDLDLLLVNGNHFKGDKQIVIINDKKKESLSRKLDRLTNVEMFVLDEGQERVHEFLTDKLDSTIPIFQIDDIESICAHILKKYEASIPLLNGLVFAGGQSKRMGRDKGAIQYYGKPHRIFLADMLDKYCDQVFLSTRKDQTDLEEDYAKLPDTFTDLGPYGGILSAFRSYPNVAWLTIACDLPLLTEKQIELLVARRNPSKLATAFYNPQTEFPEPLITIWEPRAYPVLLEFLSQGYSCPRKVLINTEIEMIEVTDATFMLNVNDQNEYDELMKKQVFTNN